MTEYRDRTGGRVLVDQLLIHGADCAYCVPGKATSKCWTRCMT